MTCLGLRTDTQLDHGCKDALGVRAGASITGCGRRCAERRAIVATNTPPTARELRESSEALLERVRAESPVRAAVDSLAGLVAELREEFGPLPRKESDRLHEYVEGLASRYLSNERPLLTLIQGGRDDAS